MFEIIFNFWECNIVTECVLFHTRIPSDILLLPYEPKSGRGTNSNDFITICKFVSFLLHLAVLTISSWQNTKELRFEIIRFYYENNRSPIAMFSALPPFYGRYNHPSVLAIRRIIVNIEFTFSLHTGQVSIRYRTTCSNVVHTAAVQASAAEDCNVNWNYSNTVNIMHLPIMP